MKKNKDYIIYPLIIGFFITIIYFIIQLGHKLETGRNIAINENPNSYFSDFINSIVSNLGHPLGLLLAQIITIMIVSRIFGYIFRKIHQPTVIGEIIAGIALGPSLLGFLFPDFSIALFPVSSLNNLNLLSQVGLVLFMFIVGMELDIKVIRNKIEDAVVISHAGIIIPFTLGIGLAYFIYEHFAPKGISFVIFGLFLGMAMSITAFPVLARIVQERNIHKTRLGAIVITCAAADDITAWCMLAAIIAIAKAGSFISSLYIIFIAVVYVILMIKVIRPFLKRIGDLHTSTENLSKPVVAIFFLTLLVSSFLTEMIGIHALFGAFLAGTIMPENQKFRHIFIQKIEDIALVMLLPLFFVFTGLRTQIGLLNDLYLWKITGLIVLVAITGKFIGSAITARIVGQNWHSSLTIGALMNTRGLMELVVLNIGYDLGILSPEIFSMMIIMALFTTFMTGPALELIDKLFKQKSNVNSSSINAMRKFRIMISFGKPEMGRSLLKLANTFVRKQNENTVINTLHLCPNSLLHHYNIDEYEKVSFAPIIDESEKLNQKITTLFKASDLIDDDIAEIANKGDYDLLLIGMGQSIFEGSMLGKILGYTTRIVNPDRIMQTVSGKEKMFGNSVFDDRTHSILSNTNTSVAIFVKKTEVRAEQIIVPFCCSDDNFLLEYIQRFINNSGSQVTIADQNNLIKNLPEVKESIRLIEHEAPNHISLIQNTIIDEKYISQFQLLVISVDGWKTLVENKHDWLNKTPSILIFRK